MNLKSLLDQSLIEKTESLVRSERELLTTVLHHLREIDRRRLFSSLGYKSLFEFAVRRLGYPEDQAYRRISAMKLLKEIPELEGKINTGEISLTHIGLAQSHFRNERKVQNKDLTQEQKILVFDQIANRSVREAERITLSLSSAPEALKPDQIKAISDNKVEMKFSASTELPRKADRLKGWLAHQYPNLTIGELFEKLCDLGLIVWDPSKISQPAAKISSEKPSKSPSTSTVMRSEMTAADSLVAPKAIPGAKIAAPRKLRVTPSTSAAQTRRDVFKKAQNSCENCHSEYALEVDHIHPRAMGGSSELSNLRILCRSCNQRAAIQAYGQPKMDRHLDLKSRS